MLYIFLQHLGSSSVIKIDVFVIETGKDMRAYILLTTHRSKVYIVNANLLRRSLVRLFLSLLLLVTIY